MHVAKIVRSGTSVSINLPTGFDVAEQEMEVKRDGASICCGLSQRLQEALDEMDGTIRTFDDLDLRSVGEPPALD